jgi:hypothetical protein
MFRYDGRVAISPAAREYPMKSANVSASRSIHVIAALLVLSLSGCAPGAWNDQSSSDVFFDTIENACPQRIGDFEISTLENNNASFLDITTQLYYGKIDTARYREFVTSFSDSTAETNQAIDCIIAHLPKTTPPAPSLLPDMGNMRNEAPPPPGTP